MSRLFRHRATAGGLLGGAVIVLSAGMTPAAAARNCTNAEMRRISDAWTINCFSHTGAQVKCQSNGAPVCCFYTGPWKGYQCTSSPSYVSPARIDPGSGPIRPPRAGTPGRPPDRVSPPAGPIKPPRFDQPPSRIGPPPTPSGPSIRSGAGRG